MPKLNFTARWIEALKPGSKPLDYWDNDLTGFGVRVSTKGVRSWTLMYRFDGHQFRIGLGRHPHVSLADARQKAKELLGDVHKGVNPAAVRSDARAVRTFEELCDDYVENYAKPKKRSWAEDKRMLQKYIIPIWGHDKLSRFTQRDIRDGLEPLRKTGRGIVANRGLSLLRTVFRYGV